MGRLRCTRPAPGTLVVTAIIASLLTPGVAMAGDKLDRARREIDGSGSSGDGRRRHRHHDDDDDGGFLGRLLAALIFGTDDDDAEHRPGYDEPPPSRRPTRWTPPPRRASYAFSRYPYRHRAAAYAVQVGPDAGSGLRPPSAAQRYARPAAGSLSLLGGYGEGVGQLELDARALLPATLDVGLRLATLYEPDPELRGPDGGPDNDLAHLGTLRLATRFMQSEAALMRVGLSGRFYADGYDQNAGLDAMVGLDLFAARPLVLSLELAAGAINQALLLEARAQLGITLRSVELFIGYSHRRIGDVHFPAAIAGTRIWL
ncbi:MAG: hypothetical protein PVI30_13955 [Myxococcales bacterium]|jgi:hypothetical protein